MGVELVLAYDAVAHMSQRADTVGKRWGSGGHMIDVSLWVTGDTGNVTDSDVFANDNAFR